MNLIPTEAHQQEMRHAHYDGAPGILVSGLVWIAATLVGYLIGTHQAVWTLLIGGALIHPLSLVVTKALGRPATTGKTNALNQLGIASTIWLTLCCAMSYGLYLLKPEFFFPAMMATIGSRYLIFASMYGNPIFWVMGICLIVAGTLIILTAISPATAAAIGGLIELLFAFYVFTRASRNFSSVN
jgi:hypothetical protein